MGVFLIEINIVNSIREHQILLNKLKNTPSTTPPHPPNRSYVEIITKLIRSSQEV